MKKTALVALTGFVTCCLSMVVFAGDAPAAPKGVKGIIVGQAIDIANYGMYGRVGAEHAEALTYRAEHGFPVGILEEETGKIYIAMFKLPVPAAGLQTGNEILLPYMGQKIVAQGTIYRAPGLNVIQLAAVGEY